LTAGDLGRIDAERDGPPLRWRVPEGQRFIFADFDDGIVMFDTRVGSTHLLNPTSAETLAILQEAPALATPALYRTLLERMQLDENALPFAAVIELLWHLEDLGLICAERQ